MQPRSGNRVRVRGWVHTAAQGTRAGSMAHCRPDIQHAACTCAPIANDKQAALARAPRKLVRRCIKHVSEDIGL